MQHAGLQYYFLFRYYFDAAQFYFLTYSQMDQERYPTNRIQIFQREKEVGIWEVFIVNRN